MLPQIHRCAVEMKRQDFFEGRWQPYLDRAAVIHPNYSGRLDGGKVCAAPPLPIRVPHRCGILALGLDKIAVNECSLVQLLENFL